MNVNRFEISSMDDLSNDDLYNNNSTSSSSDEENSIGPENYNNNSTKRFETQQHKIECVAASKKVQRLPTRRPNPNTFNRNAIMARENRRKKKEYIETLEKEITGHRRETKKLRKILRRQTKLVESLFKEKQYLRSILTNKTKIMSLVNVIKTTHHPKIQNETKQIGDSISSSFTSPRTSLLDENDFDLNRNDSWECLLGSEDLNYSDINKIDDNTFESQTNIINEHNYYNADRRDDVLDAGICLHVTNGNVSLEFCAACHENSKSPWLEAV